MENMANISLLLHKLHNTYKKALPYIVLNAILQNYTYIIFSINLENLYITNLKASNHTLTSN